MKNGNDEQIKATVAEALVNDLQETAEAWKLKDATAPPASPKLKFYPEHRSLLKPGMYQLIAEQTLDGPGGSEKTNKLKQPFLVSGPRFQLQKKDLQSVYPPAGITGDFNLNLPQISFHRSTLPWELSAKGNNNAPWLCLMLFKQDEAPKIKSKKISALVDSKDEVVDPNKEVNVITVPKHLLPQDYEALVHTRKGSEESASESAFVLGHRLPRENGDYEAHLISLRDHKDGQYISLYHWTFTCKKKKVSFRDLMRKNSTGVFRLVPEGKDNELYKLGYVPLPYFLRKGDTTLALYRSALIPPGATIDSNIKDEWISHSDTRILNRVHGCAFHLGQLLTLSNKEITGAIYAWKREFIQGEKSRENAKKVQSGFDLDQSELGLPNDGRQAIRKLPETAKTWLMSLIYLEAIPFNYLFPYEAMLPQLSIRFFKLDANWLQAILEGALSTAEETFEFKGIEKLIPESTTGFILRNPVVQHYPEMQVKTYVGNTKSDNRLLFQHKFGEDILLQCYEGKIDAFELALPGQALYPGFSKKDTKLYKTIRKPHSDNEGKEVNITDEVLTPDTHCLNLTKLKAQLEAKDSAELAAELLQSMASVKYKVVK